MTGQRAAQWEAGQAAYYLQKQIQMSMWVGFVCTAFSQTKLGIWSVSTEGERGREALERISHSRYLETEGWVPTNFNLFTYLFLREQCAPPSLTFYFCVVPLGQKTIPKVSSTAGWIAWSPPLNMRLQETKQWGLICLFECQNLVQDVAEAR